MKKIMEIYSTDNGMIIKREEKIYHLFHGIEKNEITDSFIIANGKDAIKFLLTIFEDELKIDTRTKYSEKSFGTIKEYIFSIKE